MEVLKCLQRVVTVAVFMMRTVIKRIKACHQWCCSRDSVRKNLRTILNWGQAVTVAKTLELVEVEEIQIAKAVKQTGL